MISLLIAAYIWLSVRKKVHCSISQISYEYCENFEKSNIKKNKINWEIDTSSYYKSWQTIDTRFGKLDLYKNGNYDKVVIFVHGILSNNRTSLKVLHYFNSRGYTVITYDNYGWGKSRAFGHNKLGKNAKDLLFDVISYVKNTLKLSQLIVTGESMGGGTIYAFLSKYGNGHADKFIIDAGYMSFFDNVLHLAYDRVNFLAYLATPFLALFFLFQKWPIRNFLLIDKLKLMKNVFIIQSKNDTLVKWSHAQKFIKYMPVNQIYIYKNNPDHVMGWYQSSEEHFKIYDKWLNIK
ncbi:MAG: alpha/beta hydrolase [Mycoplasma sp.]|nr:alpha/beta hydrolase [Mycoplasma sp.]